MTEEKIDICPNNPDVIQVPWEFEDGPSAPDVQVFGSDNGQYATYRIKSEDHTLGNALRWVLSSNRKVDLAAYTIPHPHTDAMNLRIQAKTGHDASELLIQGCDTLGKICKHMEKEYARALQEYQDKHKGKSNNEMKNDSFDINDDQYGNDNANDNDNSINDSPDIDITTTKNTQSSSNQKKKKKDKRDKRGKNRKKSKKHIAVEADEQDDNDNDDFTMT